MEPPLPKNPLSVLRLSLFLAGGYFLGIFVAGALCYRQPKIYEGKAKVTSPEHAVHAERITRVRAQMVARDLDLEERWDIPFDEAVAAVESEVRLKPSEQGVLVEVRNRDRSDARAIAEQVALWLDTPQREAEMAAKGVQARPFTPEQAATLGDNKRLEWLLQDQAIKEGYPSCFHLIDQAAKGDEKAVVIMKGEDFSRRWQMFEELSGKIGYLNPPGEPVKGPNLLVEVAGRSPKPISPKIDLWLNSGRFGGVLVAGVSLLALGRWRPSFLRPYPPKPPRQEAPPVIHDDQW